MTTTRRGTASNRVERTINRLKRYRRIATRYEKLTASYVAMVTVACILE